MVDVVISIAAKVAQLLVVPIGKHICYPFKYKSNITKLKRQVEKLKNQKETVQHCIDEARGQGNEIQKFVEEWMNRVDEFTDGVVKPVIDGEDNANKRCFVGLCNNLIITRYSHSKKAVKMTEDGSNLLEDGKFDVVGYRPPPKRTTSIYIEGYRDFDSRKPLFNDLMEALKIPDANLIGVHGMGGVGKTTLVKRVADQAVKDKLFDVMVIVELKQIPDIKNIQGQIADGLSLMLNEETLEGRAAQLRRTLKKEKRVLIVLDNIWSKLNLHDVGIPIGEEERGGNLQEEDLKGSNLQEEDRGGRNDDRRQCKVLLTSRSEELLSNHMNTTKNILVQVLDNQEAGDLFWKTVGDSAKNFDFEPIGVKIVKYCAGLPVAITTIASALKNKSLCDWKDAWGKLRRSNPRHIQEMEANVYAPIKLSYDFLASEEEKSLFLLCSLHNASENINIEYLLRYGMGLCLFKNVVTLEEGRNRLYMLINKLKASSLLLDGKSNKHVKMHDIVHAVGVSIASTDKLMFRISHDADVKEMLEEKLSKDSIAISLPDKNVSMLPERLEFRKLKFLFWFMHELSLEISDVFFEGMKEIKVLDLTRSRMSSLPSSLCGLTNLQTLCLDQCELGNIAVIGELKTLEILCFWGSNIEQLPKEIGQLTRLRLLELSACSKLKVISPNVIPSLTRLEELYMGNGFIHWENEGQSNAKLSDLKHLSRLTALQMHVLDARIMPQDLFFEKLVRYRILIGDVWEWPGYDESSRMMKLKLNDPIYLGEGVKGLLNTTEDLYLDELKGVKNILYQLNGEGFPRLKNLHVQNGLEMQYVINSIEWGLGNVFPLLESLFLHNLINLKKICHGQLSKGSFSKLRILQVKKCDRLKHLFSFSMANNLFHLQEIEVTNCKKLEEIVLKESEELIHQNENIRKIQFTQLHTLTLQCLPRLTSFVLNAFRPDVGSQEIVTKDEAFMPHFSQNVVLPSLKSLKLFSINIQCKWLDELPVMASCCQTLTNLTLEECNGLRFLFSYSMVKSLVLLQKLEIRNCQLIEEIINTEALRGEEKMIEMVFPGLFSLHLKGLPRLTRFGSGNLVEFPSLTELCIEECPKLKTLFSASTSSNVKQNEEVIETNCQDDIFPLFEEKVVLPTLASLNLSSIHIQTIWHNQLQAMSSSYFQHLTKIIIDGCDTLKYVFSSSMASSLIQLKVLEIINCKSMENVIIIRGERISNTMFPKLCQLHLKHLPELTSFCTVAGTVGLPSLTRLWLQNCPKMLTFVSEFPQTNMLENKEEQTNFEENQHSQMLALFNEKVRIPELKFLRLHKVDNVRKIWHHQLALDSFSKMESFGLLECHNLLNVFPSNMLGRLQKLIQMAVYKCDSLETILEISSCTVEEIVAGEDDVVVVPVRIVFPQLTMLALTSLPSLRCFYQGSYISEWPKLKKLRVRNCNKVEILTSDILSLQETHRENQLQNSIPRPLFVVDKVVFPKLEQLEVEWIWIVKDIQHGNFSKYSCNLKFLELCQVSNQGAICPCCFLYTLPNLENLRLSYPCFWEIFTCEGLDCKETHVEPPTKLSQLALIGLTGSLHPLEENYLLFKVFQRLECLEVSNCVNLKNLVPSFVSFQNLTTLEVLECNGLVNLMEGTVAKSLGQLRRLKISYCKMIEEVIAYGGDEVEDRIILNQLKYLELRSLPKLTSFCSRKYIFEFQSLQQVVVGQCPNMKTFSSGVLSTPRLHKLQITKAGEEEFWEGGLNTTIRKMFEEMVGFNGIENFVVSEFPHLQEVWHKQVLVSYFKNLKSLVVDDNCSGLRCMCTPSMAMDLAQLQQLEIKNCAILEAIVAVEEGMMRYTLFPNLNRLKLEDLPELTSFCNSMRNSIELPSLVSLWIQNCPNMQTFMSNSTNACMPESKDTTFTDVQPLFDDKVQLSSLKFLKLVKMDKLRKIWHHQLTSNSFCKLSHLSVQNCHNVLNIFSSNVLERLQKLGELRLVNCRSLDGIFELQASSCGKSQSITATQLKKLVLNGLPKLNHVWMMDSQGVLSFQSLLSIEVKGCNSLKSLIPASLARSLLRLKKLTIERCCMLEEIVAKEEEVDESIPRFVFPQLTWLRLGLLSRLRHFYPMVHISEWPMLKMLEVWNCDKVEILASKLLSLQKTEKKSQHEMPNDQPLLSFDKVPFNNLEYLALDWNRIVKESLHERLPILSCKLKILTLIDFHEETDICVSCFLHKLPNLEKLKVYRGFFKNLILYKGVGCAEQHIEAPRKLSHLRLFGLSDSLHLWEENSMSSKVFQNLAILEVLSCDNLKCLVPSAVSFQNLTTLEVTNCNGLLNVVVLSTAKSLVQLTKLSISNCKMIEEIITHEANEMEDWIIFRKLSYLKLECLPSLTSFYSGNYTIDFPSLQQVIVTQCSNMKTFSRGILSTPRLHRLRTTQSEEFWKGNLNTTIEYLFTENQRRLEAFFGILGSFEDLDDDDDDGDDDDLNDDDDDLDDDDDDDGDLNDDDDLDDDDDDNDNLDDDDDDDSERIQTNDDIHDKAPCLPVVDHE